MTYPKYIEMVTGGIVILIIHGDTRLRTEARMRHENESGRNAYRRKAHRKYGGGGGKVTVQPTDAGTI